MVALDGWIMTRCPVQTAGSLLSIAQIDVEGLNINIYIYIYIHTRHVLI